MFTWGRRRHSTSRNATGAIVGVALALGTALLWASAADAASCQASGSIPIFPSPSTSLQVGDPVTITITISNTSSTTPAPGTPVAAELRPFGTVRLKLACIDSDCAVENPGLLTFVGCANAIAGVDTCGLDPADPSGNTVLVTMNASGVALTAGASQSHIVEVNTTVAFAAEACT